VKELPIRPPSFTGEVRPAARGIAARYSAAAATIALAIAVRVLLNPVLGDAFPFATIFLAILATAWFGGRGPALLAVLLGGLASDYFLLPPRGSLLLQRSDERLGMILYAFTGAGIAALGGAMQGALRRAEAGARDAARKAAILDLTCDAILAWDWNGSITLWNRGAERLYGFPREEALDRISHDLLQTATAIGVEGFLRALERDGHWEGELEHTTRDGRRIPVETRMVLIRTSQRDYVIEANRDITTRRAAEIVLRRTSEELEARVLERTAQLASSRELIRQSELRMAGIVNSAMDAIISVDGSQRVVLFNAAAEKMFDCTAPGAIGQPVDRFIPERFRAAHARHIGDFGKTGVTSRSMQSLGALSGLRANGEEFPIEASISQIEVEGEKIFTVILRDITKRKRAEDDAAHLAAIVESSDDVIIGKDLRGIVTSWNGGAERVFGYSAPEMIGCSITRLIPPDRQNEEQDILAKVASGESVRHFETVRMRKDGSTLDISVTVSAIRDAEGRIVGASKVARDITARKRTEKALREREEQLRLYAEHSPAAIAMFDREMKYLVASRQWLAVYHLGGQEIIGRSYYEVFPEIGGRWIEIHRRCLAGAVERCDEDCFHRADGTAEWIRWEVRPWHQADGSIGGIIIFSEDITARKRAEEELNKLNAELEQRVAGRTAELETANRELDAFSYSVSHDLRAPLRALDGFSQAVIQDFGPQLPAQGQHYLRTIRKAAQQMGMLIDDLLAFSRLSRAPLKKQPVNTGQLVREVLEHLGAERQGRQIDLQVGDLPPCNGDPALLKQVWTNLLSNAFKYTGRRETAEVEIGCQSRPEGAVYFVRDNGAGFDMRYAHKLFGVFQRLHRAEDYEGTGVGLAIVQRVVHRHGGRVWAEAAPERGATFYFNIEPETKS
jgi:PAS domain S-box-containing protein